MLGIVLLSFQFHWEIVLLLLFLKLTILYTVIWTSAKKLDEKDKEIEELIILFKEYDKRVIQYKKDTELKEILRIILVKKLMLDFTVNFISSNFLIFKSN